MIEQKPQYRFASIDALRGIAALLVVWQHTAEHFIRTASIAQHGTLLADIASTFDFGRIGIICFFLISGYVIPFSFQSNKSNALKNFAIRRVFRLYPAYWVSLILIVLLNVYWQHDVSTITVLANSTMLQSLFQQPHLIGLYWTLQVELIFYLICAALFYFGVLNNNKVLFAIIALSFFAFVSWQSYLVLNNITSGFSKEIQLLPYLLATMFLGSLIRKTRDTKNKHENNLKTTTLLATLMCFGLPLLLLILSLLNFELTQDAFRFGVSHCLAFLLFFIGLKTLKNAPKFMLWLGGISYSLYLFHPIVLQVLNRIFNLQGITNLHVSFYLLATTITSIAIAAIIYKFIEKPTIKYAKNITQ